MNLLFVFLLTLSTALAQRNISREAFMVNVRPSLNAIIGDFYQMLGQFPNFPKDLIPLLETLESFDSDKENLRAACPRRVELSCKDQLDAIRRKLQRMKSLTLTLQSRQKMVESPYISTIAGIRIISDFQTELEEVSGLLDNSAFLMTAALPHKQETSAIIKELDELSTLLSLSVVEFVPYMYKDDFRHFFFNFVNPLQQHMPKHVNYDFVNREISSLNFTLNLLNMTLTKKKKTPEGMAPFLQTIHNRWNSILRYYY